MALGLAVGVWGAMAAASTEAGYLVACAAAPPAMEMEPGFIEIGQMFPTGPMGAGFTVDGNASGSLAAAPDAGPVHTAVTDLRFHGAFVPPGGDCLFGTGSKVTQPWKGTRPSDPLGIGITQAQLQARIQLDAVIQAITPSQPLQAAIRIAFDSPEAQAVNLAMLLFSDGTSVVDPQMSGVSVSATEEDDGWHFAVSGNFSLQLSLPYGPDAFEIESDLLQEAILLNAILAPMGLDGAILVGSGTTFSYTIESLDPEVEFAPVVVPEPRTIVLLGIGVAALAVSRRAR